MIGRLAEEIFGRSLSDPKHPWNVRGYNAQVAYSPRSPSEDPYGEEAYHRAFHEEVMRGKKWIPNPTHYVHSSTAKECLRARDRELFAPREWPPPRSPPQRPEQQEQQQPPFLPAAFPPPVTPTLEQAVPHPHERLPSPKYKDETPRSANKRIKRESKSGSSSSSSGSHRPWNKRQDPQPITQKPLLPASTRSAQRPQSPAPEPPSLPTADTRLAGTEQHPSVPDQHRLPFPEQGPPLPMEWERPPVHSQIPHFLEPRVDPSLGPPRMLR